MFQLSGCGSSETKSESYTYQFDLNGCETGQHQFSALKQMCEALKDDELNKFCALSLRENHYNSNNCVSLTGQF